MASEDPVPAITLEQLLQKILYSILEQDFVLLARDPHAELDWGIREIPTLDYIFIALGVSKVTLARELEEIWGPFDVGLYRRSMRQTEGKTPEVRRVLGLAMQDSLEIASSRNPDRVMGRDAFILLELSRSEGRVGEMLRKRGVNETAILEVIHKHIDTIENELGI